MQGAFFMLVPCCINPFRISIDLFLYPAFEYELNTGCVALFNCIALLSKKQDVQVSDTTTDAQCFKARPKKYFFKKYVAVNLSL